MTTMTADQFAERLARAQALVDTTIKGRFIKRVFPVPSAVLLQDLSKARNPHSIDMEIEGTDLQATVRVSNLTGSILADRLTRATRLETTDVIEAIVTKVWHSNPNSTVFTIEASEREPLLRKYRALIGVPGKKGEITGTYSLGNESGFLFEIEPGLLGFLNHGLGFAGKAKYGQQVRVRVKDIRPDGLLALTREGV